MHRSHLLQTTLQSGKFPLHLFFPKLTQDLLEFVDRLTQIFFGRQLVLDGFVSLGLLQILLGLPHLFDRLLQLLFGLLLRRLWLLALLTLLALLSLFALLTLLLRSRLLFSFLGFSFLGFSFLGFSLL
ncbi:hypothetical protein NZK35_16005, partial [Stieleria sp. ICT_E10.1]|uniref:hypothetical protein n=1 Tax=Stieleria sedimenti TaxID=2976331 RepID=UPI00217F30CB